MVFTQGQDRRLFRGAYDPLVQLAQPAVRENSKVRTMSRHS